VEKGKIEYFLKKIYSLASVFNTLCSFKVINMLTAFAFIAPMQIAVLIELI